MSQKCALSVVMLLAKSNRKSNSNLFKHLLSYVTVWRKGMSSVTSSRTYVPSIFLVFFCHPQHVTFSSEVTFFHDSRLSATASRVDNTRKQEMNCAYHVFLLKSNFLRRPPAYFPLASHWQSWQGKWQLS